MRRNKTRFPEDFMFQLTLEEGRTLLSSRSQSVILKKGQNIEYRPYAFTEHGTVMLANVLGSAVAFRASIQVVRAFVHLRRIIGSRADLARKIEALESRVGKHDTDLRAILNVLRQLLPPIPPPRKGSIGFITSAKS